MSLELLFPEGKEVVVKGETFKIRPLYFGQIPEASKLIQPMVLAMMNRGLLSFSDDKMVLSNDWPAHILNVLADVGEATINLCAFVLGKERSFFDEVTGDEGVQLVTAIFQVNADFFTSRILPMLGVKMESVIGQPGSTQSISSSPQDTGEPTSTDTP